MVKLSVLMPTVNLDEKCTKSINSILNQVGVDFELIIVIDGGTNQLTIEDPRIIIVKLPKNVGTARATNYAYAVATGDFIIPHDNDDWSEPNRFKLLLDNIGNNRAITSFITVINKNQPYLKKFHADINTFINNVRVKAPCHHCATMIRRDLWDIIGPYNTKSMAYDSIRMLKLAIFLTLNKEEFPVLNIPLYTWCINENSQSFKNSNSWKASIKADRDDKIKNNYNDIVKMTSDEFINWCHKNNF